MVPLIAFRLGLFDGLESPDDLGFGYTWDDNELANNLYDQGVNFGQFIGKILRFFASKFRRNNVA